MFDKLYSFETEDFVDRYLRLYRLLQKTEVSSEMYKEIKAAADNDVENNSCTVEADYLKRIEDDIHALKLSLKYYLNDMCEVEVPADE